MEEGDLKIMIKELNETIKGLTDIKEFLEGQLEKVECSTNIKEYMKNPEGLF